MAKPIIGVAILMLVLVLIPHIGKIDIDLQPPVIAPSEHHGTVKGHAAGFIFEKAMVVGLLQGFPQNTVPGSIFLQSIVWTVLSYNPVRILGLLGLAGLAIAGLVFLSLVIDRLNGVTSLGPWGVAALFTALIGSVAGINLFALGATFNYLVSLFYKRPIRQGLFGKPIFKTPLDQQFGWMGLALGLLGHDIRFYFYRVYLFESEIVLLKGFGSCQARRAARHSPARSLVKRVESCIRASIRSRSRQARWENRPADSPRL